GVRVEVLDEVGVEAAEPNLRPGMVGGLRVPEDAVLYPPCAARFLLGQAKQYGAEFRTPVTVSDLLPEGGVALAGGERISADRSVNATGPWSPALTPGLPVRKRKGHLVVTDRHPGFVHHQIVELGYLKSAHSVSKDSVAFNIQPRKTGQVLIGSSRQFNVEHDRVEPPVVSQMLQRAFEYLPALGSLSGIRVWTGFRPATPDKLPLIGPWSEDPTLYVATGHEGLGITTSLATAKLIRAQITGA